MEPRRAITFVNGAIVAPEGRIASSIRIKGGRIDSLGAVPARRDVVVDLDGSVLFPGLINAHDHLELNSFGRLKWRERYCNVREWIADFQPRFRSDPRLAGAVPHTLDDRLWAGALKNLLAGVTTVCHHNPLHPALNSRYPVRVVRRFGLSHSLGVDGSRVADVHHRTPDGWPWIVHAAEGVDAEAAGEIDVLEGLGCLTSRTVLVHGVALAGRRATQVIDRGGSLVWCPTSNAFLFGATADVRAFDAVGRLALGTDSRLSGAGDLLDELRAAHATRQVSPASLFRAVSDSAARVLRLPDAGRLVPGAAADLCVIRRLSSDPLETLAAARRTNVRLTMIGGRTMICDEDLQALADAAYARVYVDGVPKIMSRRIAQRAARMTISEPGVEVTPC